jgi:hypothetical protein
MNSSARKWQSIRNEQRVEVGLVQVDIGGRSEAVDRFTGLALKRAKDVLRDALLRSAEEHGGKLSSWEEDGGTFIFLIDDPDSFNNCCLAAIDMLEQLPSVKHDAQLSAELERLILVRIVCDSGTVTCEPEARNVAGDVVERIAEHKKNLSAENKVMITDRIFRQLKSPLKSRFVKWKHSPELDVDLYAASERALRVAPGPADLPEESEPPTELQSNRSPILSGTLRSRTVLSVAGLAFLALLVVAAIRLWPGSSPPVQPSTSTDYSELVQSEEWRRWRKQFHEKLSAGEVTEKTLADALRIKLPARPEQAAEALRRDQAIGDVLMAYPGVRKLLWDRFGIDEHNFLGTGLSKPSIAANNYGAATIHEYLIKNCYADTRRVVKLTFDPIKNSEYMRMTVGDFLEKGPKPVHDQPELLKEITQRMNEMKEKDARMPAVIRFARFNAVQDSRKLGPPNRHYVFASNLAEVWNTRVIDAAEMSGYISKNGDTMYIWIFLASHAPDVVPATWDQILNNLPTWLTENDRD